MILVTLPIKTVTEGNAKEHWRTKSRRAKKQRTDSAWMVYGASATAPWMGCGPGGLGARCLRNDARVIVTMTRISPGTLDDDNLVGSQKHVRDGIADALGIDDRDPRVVWRYEQRRGKRGECFVEVKIEPTTGETT